MSFDDPETLARIRALPCWTGEVTPEPLDGGITNRNFTVNDGGRAYVVRLGHDIAEHMIARWNELAISRAAHRAGLAPEVIHAEPGVLVLEKVEAEPLAEADLHDPRTLSEVVDLVRKLHDEGLAQVRGPVLSFWVFHILREYAAQLRALNSRHKPILSNLLDEARALERAVGRVRLVLGHNDLLPANILRGADRLWLIDWEYGGLNSPLFDLGGLASNADLEPEAERGMLCHYYRQAPTEALMQRYGAMKCASLLRETMWSMVSEQTSDIDFDYASYTAENLDRYRRAHEKFAKGHVDG